MGFEPKFIEDTGFCEKINGKKGCALCYWNRGMVCTFSFHTKEEQKRINDLMKYGEDFGGQDGQ